MLVLTLCLILFVVSLIIELMLPWLHRKYKLVSGAFTITGSVSMLVATVVLLYLAFNVATVMIAIITVYRLVSYARIYSGRMHEAYLRSVSPRTTICTAAAQVELWLIILIWRDLDPSLILILYVVTVLQLSTAIIMYISLHRHIRHAFQPVESNLLSTNQLPTITIAVAARNESAELIACLESLIASDYPKLEILVLDDCSQNRRTAEIIRSFASCGVRFVPGGEPNSSWLARNHAYNTLAKAASGSYILYCSTSVRLMPGSLRKIINYMASHNKNMLSIMPGYSREHGQHIDLEAMRAAWELLPPRHYIGRPPVFSSCWMVRTSALKKLGGFAAVSRMIIPETYFASCLAADNAYSFIQGNVSFGVTSPSEVTEQSSRAVRTYYPMLHRRPESVLLFSFVVAATCLLPFLLLFSVVYGAEFAPVSVLALITSAILLRTYHRLTLLMFNSADLHDTFIYPVAVGRQLALLQVSMYRYEFSTVTWRNRNVCIPVMHVVPHLPKI